MFGSDNKMDTCIDREIFVDQKQVENFQCIIGFGVVNNPVSDNCGHVYCEACIKNWISKNKNCPLSKQMLNVQDLRPILPVKNLLDNLQVRCQTCQYEMNLVQWKLHVLNCEGYQIDQNFSNYSDNKQFVPFIKKIMQLKQEVLKLKKQKELFTGKEKLNLLQMKIINEDNQDFVITKKIKIGFPFCVQIQKLKDLFGDFLKIHKKNKDKTLQDRFIIRYGLQMFTQIREIKILFTKRLLNVKFCMNILEDGCEVDFPKQYDLPGKIKDMALKLDSTKDGFEVSFQTFPSFKKKFQIECEQITQTNLYAEKITTEEFQLNQQT